MSRKHARERVRRRKSGYLAFSSAINSYNPYAFFSARRRRKASNARVKRFWDSFFI